MSTMLFPEDFPAQNEQIGIMTFDFTNDKEDIFIEMWGERVEIDGATTWPLGGEEWKAMLNKNGLKLKKLKRWTNVVRA